MEKEADLNEDGYKFLPPTPVDKLVKQIEGHKVSNPGSELSPGRTHYELNSPTFLCSPAMVGLAQRFLPHCKTYFGQRMEHVKISTIQLVESSPGSDEQVWHADNSKKGLTFVVALTDVTAANGPTQFIERSHTQLKSLPRLFAPTLKMGQVMVFDSRMVHRGLSNRASSRRDILVVRYDDTATPPPGMSFPGAMLRHLLGKLVATFS
ncbi:hypothetical protein B484DRAFT_456721 [Ochromonadaceae sp. CCMP2298]|nr:hypothetical protein B484DRAFT_456721 [Ochromonadaceae sp. CCMP2298]|mmetsp:Transcript_30838/g.68086  ORF Transcript_30838/g.68086 Transcript_30838/m.68086 type:complete len:208 (-) Transcript_30838:210-833(-)